MRRTVFLLAALVYPFAVFLGLGVMQPRSVAILALALIGIRVALGSPMRLLAYGRAVILPVAAVVTAVLASVVLNDRLGMLAAPALVNFSLLASFASSLLTSESTIEKIARTQAGNLSVPEIEYCRNVTRIWCLFFFVNGAVSLALASAGTLQAWTLYTGLVSYLLVGVLFGCEFVYRHWRFRRYFGLASDGVLKRIFPASSQ